MRKVAFWTVFLGLVFGGICFEAGAVEKSLVRVRLMIQADEEIQAAAERILQKELRSLGDISLVREKPDFEIRVIVLGSAAKEKENAGVAFSTVFLRPYARSGIPDFYSSRCRGDKEALNLTGKLAEAQVYQDHLLQVGSGKDIEQICKDIAHSFKTNILAPPRMPLQNR